MLLSSSQNYCLPKWLLTLVIHSMCWIGNCLPRLCDLLPSSTRCIICSHTFVRTGQHVVASGKRYTLLPSHSRRASWVGTQRPRLSPRMFKRRSREPFAGMLSGPGCQSSRIHVDQHQNLHDPPKPGSHTSIPTCVYNYRSF